MKIKLLTASLVFAAIVSSNSFAVEITKGKLIQHKEWTTSHAKAVFRDINPSQLKSKLKLNSSRTQFTHTLLDIGHGVAGQPTSIDSIGFIYYQNSENKNETIGFEF